MGGVLIRIRGKGAAIETRCTRQLAYVADDVDRVFLSRKTMDELEIIGNKFSTIGAYMVGHDTGEEKIMGTRTPTRTTQRMGQKSLRMIKRWKFLVIIT